VHSFTIEVMAGSGRQYQIKLADDGSLWCNCPAWRVSAAQAGRDASHRTCKHIDAVTHSMAQHFANVRGQQ